MSNNYIRSNTEKKQGGKERLLCYRKAERAITLFGAIDVLVCTTICKRKLVLRMI